MYTVEDYNYFKNKGICVRCRRERAEKGKSSCLDCLEKNALQKRSYVVKQDSKLKLRKYNKRKKDLCVAFKVCVNCLNRDAKKGQVCIECWLKRQVKYREKKNDIRRDERYEYGVCYFCGDEVVEGKRVCEKHLKQCQANMKIAISKKSKIDLFRDEVFLNMMNKENKIFYKKNQKSL